MSKHKRAKKNSIWAIIVGFLFVIIASVINNHNSKAHLVYDIFKELGIALLIAGIIFFIYEYSTRNEEKSDLMKPFLDTIFGVDTPHGLWGQIKNEVLSRAVSRSKMRMTVKISKTVLIDGKTITVPNGQGIIQATISYSLKNSLQDNIYIDIKHHLDYHMYNAAFDLPRFVDAKINYCAWRYPCVIDKNSFSDGCLTLPKVYLEAAGNEADTVEIITTRYEVVNIPGLYTIVLPEMIVITGDNEPTIAVTIEKDTSMQSVGVSVETWSNSPNGKFMPTSDRSTWLFKSVMLPGQGFSLVFKA